MKPGHGEVLVAEGDVEVPEDERELIEAFRRQLDEGLWAAVPKTTRNGRREASMVKLLVTETAQKASLEGMQMMGGYGYSSEYDMERLVRQTLVSTIYGGTSEIQRNIIAKTLGL